MLSDARKDKQNMAVCDNNPTDGASGAISGGFCAMSGR
jgi:hypothetical protein